VKEAFGQLHYFANIARELLGHNEIIRLCPILLHVILPLPTDNALLRIKYTFSNWSQLRLREEFRRFIISHCRKKYTISNGYEKLSFGIAWQLLVLQETAIPEEN
jgi:hypothetical protein